MDAAERTCRMANYCLAGSIFLLASMRRQEAPIAWISSDYAGERVRLFDRQNGEKESLKKKRKVSCSQSAGDRQGCHVSSN